MDKQIEKRERVKELAEEYYNQLYPVYEKMIEIDLEKNEDEDTWLQAETKLDECLRFLEKIFIDREER